MPTDLPTKLLQLQAQLDQLLSHADQLASEPLYADLNAMAEQLRELIVDRQARVEEKLDALA